MKLIGKISVRDVFGAKGQILEMVMKDKGDSHKLMRVVGIASGLQTGEGDNGPWTGLKGQFRATNLLTGEEFSSGKCFLPNVAQDMVVGAIMADGASAVEFAFDISVQFEESAATSYIYSAESLIQPKENDPLSMLLHGVQFSLKLEDKTDAVEKPHKK